LKIHWGFWQLAACYDVRMDEAKLSSLRHAANLAAYAWKEYENLIKTDPKNSKRRALWAVFQEHFTKLCEIEEAIGDG
jgi:hypothetical protein